MWEGPQAQLFLGDLPEPRQAQGLDDEEKDDQPAEDDELEVGHYGMRDLDAEGVLDRPGRQVEEDRQQRDESGAEEAAEDRAHAADDHHEQDPEGQIQAV